MRRQGILILVHGLGITVINIRPIAQEKEKVSYSSLYLTNSSSSSSFRSRAITSWFWTTAQTMYNLTASGLRLTSISTCSAFNCAIFISSSFLSLQSTHSKMVSCTCRRVLTLARTGCDYCFATYRSRWHVHLGSGQGPHTRVSKCPT
jgi:hypothetical protein